MTGRALWPAIVVGVLTLAAALRFRNLEDVSVWFDEAASWYQSKDTISDLLARTAQDNYPPLHNLILHMTIALVGDGEFALRLPSVLFGIAGVGAIYWLGALTLGRPSGALAATILAVSSFHVVHSQQARMYSLLALAATLLAITCFRFLQGPSMQRGIWLGLAGLTLVYSHPFGILNWLTIVGATSVLVLPRESLSKPMIKVWLASNTAVLIGFAPWAYILMTRAIVIAGEGFHIPYPTPLRLWFDLTSLLGGKVVGALILAGLILAAPQWRRADIQVFSLWATLPFAVGLAASVLLTPVLAARYVAGSLPPILLISAWGLLRFFVGRQMVLAAAVAGAWAAVALFRADPYSKEKEDWRSVAAFLAANFGSSDCILIVPKRDVLSLQYYRADDRGCVLSTSDVGGLPSPIDARRLFYVFKTIVRAAADEVKVALEADGWVEGARSVYAGIEIVELSRPE